MLCPMHMHRQQTAHTARVRHVCVCVCARWTAQVTMNGVITTNKIIITDTEQQFDETESGYCWCKYNNTMTEQLFIFFE